MPHKAKGENKLQPLLKTNQGRGSKLAFSAAQKSKLLEMLKPPPHPKHPRFTAHAHALRGGESGQQSPFECMTPRAGSALSLSSGSKRRPEGTEVYQIRPDVIFMHELLHELPFLRRVSEWSECEPGVVAIQALSQAVKAADSEGRPLDWEGFEEVKDFGLLTQSLLASTLALVEEFISGEFVAKQPDRYTKLPENSVLIG